MSKLTLAVNHLRAKNVIAYPTESVWGLGCLPEHDTAIQRILELKNRSWDKGLILVAANWQQLERWIEPLSASQLSLLQTPQTRPTTWLLPCPNDTSKYLCGAHQTLAVRVSEHPLISALCEKVGALVSTSANVQNQSPAMSCEQVHTYFGNRLDYVLAGELGGFTQPSSIKTLDGRQLR